MAPDPTPAASGPGRVRPGLRRLSSSLRSQLLLWLLVPLAGMAVLDTWSSYREAEHTATLVQQRLLLGAARMIGQQAQYQDDSVQVVVPPAALELFAGPQSDRVYYRITRGNGELLLGYPELPDPPHAPAAEEAVYFDTQQNGVPVHAVAFAQPLLGAPEQAPLHILVAQTLNSRNALTSEVWRSLVWRQGAVLGLMALLLGLGLRRGLQPVLTLRDQMLQRRPGSLEPLAPGRTPTELAPLVDAVNDYATRLDHHMSAHSRFIADAAHQLRTPLTVLNTQVVYALRTTEPAARQEALQATLGTVQHGMRLVNQLLSFSLAEASQGQARQQEPMDLARCAQDVLEALATLADQRDIDLGFETEGGPFHVRASPRLLHELCANLLDNALRYTPPGGRVTLRVMGHADLVELQVEDNGPGIPATEREQVFERFYRLNNRQSDGCGLGLAIVREIANASQAQITLDDAPGAHGLLVRLVFPACAA
ncbi:sensor histidine kinase [Curvibacter sp. HBC28]|uniref:histidine kinase n=1 Tax=Curvibacter microcysteis TaxID=3026419 RepID=A0ABT5MFI5_9BURK|nr:sensor histidine kinase [Curvibacter sp. HBC28]MDD0815337.1 sensor histidine kinase [Curvibacter sp. HBC28]